MKSFVIFTAVIAVTAACACPLTAQQTAEHAQGILVPGTGDVMAKPNLIEIQMRSAAKAELTGDAIVKYRDAKKRTLEAFAALKVENVELEEEGLSIMPGNGNAAMMMRFGNVDDSMSKTQIEMASTLTVRLKGIEQLKPEEMTETIGKILDAAQDSGAAIGPSAEELAMMGWYGRFQRNSVVKFVLSDVASLREKAYAKAAQDARTRAERQAKLFGVELGDVLSVQEVFVSGDEHAPARASSPWDYMMPDESSNHNKQPRITSDTYTEIPIRVKLMVRFGIKPGAPKTAAAN